MKIKSIEVDTDLGRRVVQVSPPIDVDPTGEMPPHFRSLTELLWNVLRQVATDAQALSAPKAEA
ncbi:MAG TPA: hypothetical protein VLE97_05925 [Gaiellaceae bacterium]|nr:hypothetical protein [Gaiellaceae bacterium]